MDGIKVHLVVLALVCCHHSSGLDLVTYQTASYTNPVTSSEFTHFVTHNETGTIYIGVSNALYQLRKDFVLQQDVDTTVECEDDTMCPNYNKILVIDYANNTLITCGSENYHAIAEGKGACNIRNITKITQVFLRDRTRVVPSGLLTTEAIIAPGPDGQYLYVANTYDERNTDENFIIARRFLSTEGSSRIFTSERFTSLSTTASTLRFKINFIKIFSYDGFTYFVTHQEHSDVFISKISRVCHGDTDTDLGSFTEVTLECQGQSGNINNLIQAAYVGPAGPDLAASLEIDDRTNVLYGVFAKSVNKNGYDPSTNSSLCIFKMEDIKEALFEAVAGCLGRNNPNSQDHLVKYLGRRDDSCPGFDIPDSIVTAQLCSPINWQYAKGIVPLVSTAVIEWSDMTPSSVITAIHRNHTIAFVGTMQGDLTKVHIEDNNTAREYERFSVGSHVLRDAEIDSNKEQLTILTKQQLLSLSVSKCDEYTTCDDCIGFNGGQDGDPYCGWCTLKKRCTQYDPCPMADVSTRWMPYNSAQCVGISHVAPYDSLPITMTEQQITLTVEQLPYLTSDNSYQCIFDNLPAVPAVKDGNLLTCATPAAADIPAIPAGSDHVTMALSIYSTETNIKFVQTDLHFYECNFHIGCVACTNSSWACDWCIYSNKCTYDNSKCSNEDDGSSIINGINNPEISQLQGPEKCPQLLAQDGEILIPVGVSREIKLDGINLPADERVVSYMCILNIEGTEVSMMAERNGDVVTCISRMYLYDAEIQELDVSLIVVWNGNRRLDDIHGFKVTLYRCVVGRSDCSNCLSNLTARPELMCGWCKAGAMCTVTDSSQCSGSWISASDEEGCPAPIISGVWPLSGPFEGNTIISVNGTDLGRQFADIMSVTVGGQDCSTDGLSLEYVTGNSISCRTSSGTIDSEESISVLVRGTDGTVQQSTGNVVFTYRDPSITSIEPVEGPAAGGTMVTITGQYLDACSHINATIGSAECRMNRIDDVINATTAMCHTTEASAGTPKPLQVYFDGAMRQSADKFTYRPNPTVVDVQPLKTIQSGGITLTVAGSGFNLAQIPRLILTTDDGRFTEGCDVHNNTMMRCKTPSIQFSSSSRKRAALGEEASFGFIIADVSDLKTWSVDNNVIMETYEDPTYMKFDANPKIKEGEILFIMGRNLNAGSSKVDVTVYIGEDQAAVNSLGVTALTITLPANNPGRQCINGNRTDHPCIVVFHGNLEFYIGSIDYPEEPTLPVIIGGVSVIVFLVLLVALALGFYVVKSRKFKKENDALILERLILLQRRVDETIHNLTTESVYEEVAQQASIILPNNMRIKTEDVKIRYNELTMGRSLGHGAFGEVFLADLQTTGNRSIQVAAKSIQGEKDPSTIIKFLEEGLIMKDFNHPNVLGLIGLTFDPEGNPLVILPLMKNGDLKSFLKKTTMKITTEQRLRFAIDAAKGMAYLTGNKFVHRDLAARNCMVDEDLVVKIGDFGRSRDMEGDYDYISQDQKAKLPVKWMAPESLDRKLYNEKTDVWSFGILLWEIFTNGTKPYKSIANRDVYNHISIGNRLSCPNGCKEDVYDIMLHCWNMNPKDRCTFQEVSQRLSIILNIHINATTENQDKVEATSSSSDVNRHSHFQFNPMEEEIAEGDDTGDGKDLVNCDSDPYPNPMEQHNTAFAMEMTTLN